MTQPIKAQLKEDALELKIAENKLSNEEVASVAALSAAISLKRIADALVGSDAKLGLIDSMFEIHERKMRNM